MLTECVGKIEPLGRMAGAPRRTAFSEIRRSTTSARSGDGIARCGNRENESSTISTSQGNYLRGEEANAAGVRGL